MSDLPRPPRPREPRPQPGLAPRKRFEWKLKERSLSLGSRTLLMGILNVTPDSFSDGGLYQDPDRAVARALEMEQQGADIIDIGAESTRPGSSRLSEEDEWRRLEPVLKQLPKQLGVPISLDTYKAEIARRAFDLGVEIINDPSGLTFDPNLAKVVGQQDGGLIVNHMRGTPETWSKLPGMPDPLADIGRGLDASVGRALTGRVLRPRIVVDPGLGFGKRKEQNYEIITRLPQIARLELPLLVGPSRKAFLARPTEQETRFATAAAVTACILQGAHIVRVHDVLEMRIAADVADALLANQPTLADKPDSNVSRAAPRRSF